MNKLILTYFLFFLYSFACITAQELPPITNFSSKTYKAKSQNWSISQSDKKYIYIANNGGLLEYDGENWKLYQSPNYTVMRSVKVIKDRIYTGCYMEFGFWEKNKFDDLEYTSLIPKLKKQLIEDEQFWNIVELGNSVLFQSLNRIYIYNLKDHSFHIIESKTKKAQIFKLNNDIYFQQENTGLFKIEDGKPVLVSNNPILKNKNIVGLFEIDGKKLVLTENAEFYFIKNTIDITKWNLKANELLKNLNIFSSLHLKDGGFALGSISKGLFIIDKNGHFKFNTNKSNGLINNTVLSIHEDIENNIWLGLDNGISVLNVNSAFQVYNDFDGSLGVVYTSIIYNDNLYIGTNQGVFYKKRNQIDTFKFVKNTKGQVWSLHIIDDTLFCGHNSGTYIIKNNSANQISEIPGTWGVKKIANQKHLLIQGNYSGLNILEKKNNTWRFRNKIEGFNISSRFFEFIKPNQLIINHEQKGIHTLTIDSDFKKITKQKVQSPNGYGSSIIKYQNDILFTSSNGIYKYEKNQQKFIHDSLLSQKFFNDDNTMIGVLIPDTKNNQLWGFSNENILSISLRNFDNTLQEKTIPIPSNFRNNLGVTGFECLIHLKKQHYLIGGSNGYITLDLNKIKDIEYDVYINKAVISDLTNEISAIDLSTNGDFENNKNNIAFNFSSPNYDQFSETQYKYQLIGLYEKWSPWSTTASATFNNLPFGKYAFKVQSKVGNTNSKNTATYTFTIARPWYITNIMIGLYSLFIILFSLFMHQMYKRYYTKQKEQHLRKTQRKLKLKQLENEQQKMMFANEKLQQDVESKGRELAISTMSLIKKNEFLNKIKEELQKKKITPEIHSVIKIIDTNLNDMSDWKFFEQAFNNADKDFLKNIKSKHPELTSNDLRLCAYLRLNLSSKEIAPLLNISSKSVEMKRYRLRKKINLPHNDSLTSYILDL